MDLDIFYSTATEELLADCILVQLVLESLGQLRLYAPCPMTCCSLSCTSKILFILSITSWNLSNMFYTLFILSTTCWNLANIFYTLFILSNTCWNLSYIFCTLLSCLQPATTCLTSSAPCSSCPQFAEAYPRPTSSSDIILLVLFSFFTGGGPFTLTVETLFGCDKGRVCNTGEEDPLA